MPAEGIIMLNTPRDEPSGGLRAKSLNRMGVTLMQSLDDWLIENGYGFHLQLGTEDAPIASTTSLDDELVWALVDVPAGWAIRKILNVEAHTSTWTTATVINAMLEIDNGKVRYSSGGSAFTPLNLNTGHTRTSGFAAYVGTDIAAAAKTASGSLEISRQCITEDVITTANGGEKYFKYEPKVSPLIIGPASLLLHFGCATADVTGYGCMSWIQCPTSMLSPVD